MGRWPNENRAGGHPGASFEELDTIVEGWCCQPVLKVPELRLSKSVPCCKPRRPQIHGRSKDNSHASVRIDNVSEDLQLYQTDVCRDDNGFRSEGIHHASHSFRCQSSMCWAWSIILT